MTPPKKLSKLSQKLVSKKNLRKTRKRLRKFIIFLNYLSAVIFVLCIILIVLLLKSSHRPRFISPLVSSFINESNDDKKISDIEKLLREKKISYKSVVKVENDDYKIILADSSQVIISLQKDLNMEISSLQYILTRLTMEGKHFTNLDLRFDKPVIVFK